MKINADNIINRSIEPYLL